MIGSVGSGVESEVIGAGSSTWVWSSILPDFNARQYCLNSMREVETETGCQKEVHHGKGEVIFRGFFRKMICVKI